MDGRAKRGGKLLADTLGISRARQQQLYSLVSPGLRRELRDNAHLRMLLAFALSPDSNCIDVGAHKGDVLREMCRVAPHGNHIAYEPLPALANRLAETFPNVLVRQAALSSENGEAAFVHVKHDPGYSGLRERTYRGQQEVERLVVRTETLDSTLPEDYVPRLIKIDVEGAERQVLEGALSTLKRHQPIIYFEHGQGSSDHYGTRPSHIYELLVGEAGLRIFDVDGGGPYSAGEFGAVFSRPIWNFVAHA